MSLQFLDKLGNFLELLYDAKQLLSLPVKLASFVHHALAVVWCGVVCNTEPIHQGGRQWASLPCGKYPSSIDGPTSTVFYITICSLQILKKTRNKVSVWAINIHDTRIIICETEIHEIYTSRAIQCMQASARGCYKAINTDFKRNNTPFVLSISLRNSEGRIDPPTLTEFAWAKTLLP